MAIPLRLPWLGTHKRPIGGSSLITLSEQNSTRAFGA